MASKQSVFLCNMVIAALCVLSIVAYFIMPFWGVNVKYTLTSETLAEFLPDTSESESDGLLSGINFADLLDEDIELKLSIELQTSQVLSAMSSDPTALVEDILSKNVHNIVSQIEPHINTVVKNVVKVVVKDTFKTELKNQIKDSLGENTTDEKAQEELNNMGLNDEYIDKKTDQLIETIYKEGTTVDDAVTETVDIVKESLDQMKASGNEEYANVELTEEQEEELKEMLTEKFDVLKQEDGTIDPEKFTGDFLLSLLNGEEIDPGLLGSTKAKPLAAKAGEDTASKEQTDAKSALSEMLTKELMGLLSGATDVIAMVLKYVGYLVIFNLIVWAIPLLMIFIKIASYNNTINLSLPIWLGWLPFAILYLAPQIALSSLAGNLTSLGLAISFSTCAIIPALVSVALAVMSIVFYRRWRKEMSY